MSNEKDKTNKPRKTRNFSAITYLNESQIKEVMLKHSGKIKGYAYILHNLDTNEDGSKKEEHRHILIKTVNATTTSGIKSWFSGYFDSDCKHINTIVQEMHDTYATYCYLSHKTAELEQIEGKAVYKEEDIKGSNIEIFKDEITNDKDCITMAVQDLLEGLTLKDVALKYGRDFIIHYHSIKLLLNDIYEQERG